jgi:hypothetical protein
MASVSQVVVQMVQGSEKACEVARIGFHLGAARAEILRPEKIRRRDDSDSHRPVFVRAFRSCHAIFDP